MALYFDRILQLSRRESETLHLIGEGLTTKEIATKLGLSNDTIASYRKHICRKLRLHSTAELITFSIRQDLYRGVDVS